MRKYLRNRWILNLGLLVVIVVLLSLSQISEEETPEPPATLAGNFPEPITDVRILRSGKLDIHFQLLDGYWHMLKPYQARAETSLIEQVLSLTALPAEHVAGLADINSVEFGLHQPAASIALNGKLVRFGHNQPVNQQRYIELDKQVMLIPDRYMMHLKAGSISYIDRHLVPPGSKVQSLQIDEQVIDLQQDQDKLQAWMAIKANWISLAADDYQPQGINIKILLKDIPGAIHYVVDKRDADIVFTDMQSRLEYHMPLTDYESLGISIPASPDEAQPPASDG